MAAKIALITGITGQDGSYLAEFLLEKGYEVHGIVRKSSNFNTFRIDHIYRDRHTTNVKLRLHYGDLTDYGGLLTLISKIKPDEIYNLAAQSHVGVSFELPCYTASVDAVGVLNILEAIRSLELTQKTRFYQASTSELFGLVQEIPQTEKTPFYPRSPYACAKLYAYWAVVNYREAYKMHLSNGILFNHESPRRGATFVTRKITKAVAKIKIRGPQPDNILYLGNIDSKRDWGHAKEYVTMMWTMLQQDVPDDYVCGSGETHSVREFVEKAFTIININITWTGEGVNEIASNDVGQVLVKIDPVYYRPTEVDILISNPEKARVKLGWNPQVTFDQLVEEMVLADIDFLQNSGNAY